ncbi:PREDICTED: zinc finger CCHC domain-containing protein 4, partial [Nicrophorus vespilloides]|uniref:Zinc finger CCHC domain-containing protein 4 n=1 Tax=Nicrophorus vespilloides TaxID=110193 RepID=A0ABM1MKJ3_NICVS
MGIKVIESDLSKHPKCPHGPTLLFTRTGEEDKPFFACSACRDRKDCEFFLWQSEYDMFSKAKNKYWEGQAKKYLRGVDHENLYSVYEAVSEMPENERMFCKDCSVMQLDIDKVKHQKCNTVFGVSDDQMKRPTEMFQPLENDKTEAQYLFTKDTVKTIVEILRKQNLTKVLCIGAPRIHEHIANEREDMKSMLLDLDRRFHNFYGPKEFCWYNSFNNHFFSEEAKTHFREFLTLSSEEKLVIVTDPPFGGRVEPLAATFKSINKLQQEINGNDADTPILWIYPYFMEPMILGSFPDFHMCDFKVDYDNHTLFTVGPKGRKKGSPVRIFTNLKPEAINLSGEDGYKHCETCKRWVSAENRHCAECGACTSKDGSTYNHCLHCKRCVKESWKHCNACNRCAFVEHRCGQFEEIVRESKKRPIQQSKRSMQKKKRRFNNKND